MVRFYKPPTAEEIENKRLSEIRQKQTAIPPIQEQTRTANELKSHDSPQISSPSPSPAADDSSPENENEKENEHENAIDNIPHRRRSVSPQFDSVPDPRPQIVFSALDELFTIYKFPQPNQKPPKSATANEERRNRSAADTRDSTVIPNNTNNHRNNSNNEFSHHRRHHHAHTHTHTHSHTHTHYHYHSHRFQRFSRGSKKISRIPNSAFSQNPLSRSSAAQQIRYSRDAANYFGWDRPSAFLQNPVNKMKLMESFDPNSMSKQNFHYAPARKRGSSIIRAMEFADFKPIEHEIEDPIADYEHEHQQDEKSGEAENIESIAVENEGNGDWRIVDDSRAVASQNEEFDENQNSPATNNQSFPAAAEPTQFNSAVSPSHLTRGVPQSLSDRKSIADNLFANIRFSPEIEEVEEFNETDEEPQQQKDGDRDAGSDTAIELFSPSEFVKRRRLDQFPTSVPPARVRFKQQNNVNQVSSWPEPQSDLHLLAQLQRAENNNANKFTNRNQFQNLELRNYKNIAIANVEPPIAPRQMKIPVQSVDEVLEQKFDASSEYDFDSIGIAQQEYY